MSDAGEVKAKVIVEYDGSGIDKAKEDLASLGDMAGSFGSAGGSIGDALGKMASQAEEATRALTPFTEAATAITEPLQTGGASISELNDALGTHQQALLDAGSAYQALSEPLGSAVQLLQGAGAPIALIAEHAAAMNEQVGGMSDGFTQIHEALGQSFPMLPAYATSLQDMQQPMSYITEHAQSFVEPLTGINEAVSTAVPLLPQYAESLQTTGASFASLHENAAATGQMFTESANGYQAFTEQFNGLGDAAAGAEKSISETGAALGETAKAGSGFFGEGGVLNGLLGNLGAEASSGGGLFGGLMMGLSNIAMPLMAVQMIGMAIGQVATGIYNAAAIAEGPAAHSFGTFTGSVDGLNQSLQQTAGSFSESFGKQLVPTIQQMSTALADPAVQQIAQQVGGAVGGFIGGGINDIMTLTGDTMKGIGYLTGNQQMIAAGTELFNAGQGILPVVQQGIIMTQSPAAFAQSSYMGGMGGVNSPEQQLFAFQAQNAAGYAPPSANPSENYRYFTGLLNGGPPAAAGPFSGGITQDQVNAQYGQGGALGPVGDFFRSVFGPMGQSFNDMWGAEQSHFFGPSGNGDPLGDFFGGLGQDWNNFTKQFNQGDPNVLTSTGCFIAGTRVLLADGTKATIETLRPDQQVLASDGHTQRPAMISATMAFAPKPIYALTFSDSRNLTLTDAHPLASPGHDGALQWKSLNPAATQRENPDLDVSLLRIGDQICTVNGVCTLIDIEAQRKPAPVYNISVEGLRTYYANGVLVHNKAGLQMAQPSSGGFNLSNIADNIGQAVSSIQLPHIDLSGMASSIGGAFSGIQLPHLDLGGMASSIGGAFSGIQLPHLDLSGIGSSLGGAFSGIQLPHIDLSGITSSLSGAFSGISLPSIPNIAGEINSTISGMFSGFSLPSIPNIAGSINSAIGNMFSGFSLPSIPNVAGEINSTLSNIFSGFSLPSIPNIAGAVNSTISQMFSGFSLPSIPNIAAMINGAIGSMFSGIMIPAFASGIEGFSGGLALVGEAGPELVSLPGGSSVYPLTTGAGVGNSPISLGGGGSGGAGSAPQSINLVVQLDSQALIAAIGLPMSQNIRVGMGLRSF